MTTEAGWPWATTPPMLFIANSIIWGNTAGFTSHPSQISTYAGGFVLASYSDVEGGFAGVGNIDTDPLFVDAAVGDYHLQAGSPCIDAADPLTTLTEDIEGNPRPAGSGYDMGAYEYQP